MSLWRQFIRGLRVLTNRRGADQKIADEVEGHREQAVAGLGVLIGLGGAATQAIATLLFGVSRLDPITYLSVIGLLATRPGDGMLGARLPRRAGRSFDYVKGGLAIRPNSAAISS